MLRVLLPPSLQSPKVAPTPEDGKSKHPLLSLPSGEYHKYYQVLPLLLYGSK
jgi:hypothetical protein